MSMQRMDPEDSAYLEGYKAAVEEANALLREIYPYQLTHSAECDVWLERHCNCAIKKIERLLEGGDGSA